AARRDEDDVRRLPEPRPRLPDVRARPAHRRRPGRLEHGPADALRRRHRLRRALPRPRRARVEQEAVTQAPVAEPARAKARPAPGGAVVLGGDYRALGVVRSLGRHGVPVAVVREGDDRLAALSRFAKRRFPWPDVDEGEQVAYLLELARKE